MLMPKINSITKTIYVPLSIIMKNRIPYNNLNRFLIEGHECFAEELELNPPHPLSAELIANRITRAMSYPNTHYSQFQVGDSLEDANFLINQHSWYKKASGYLFVEMEVDSQYLYDQKKSETDLLHEANPSQSNKLIMNGEKKFLAFKQNTIITTDNIVALHKVDCAKWSNTKFEYGYYFNKELREKQIGELNKTTVIINLRTSKTPSPDELSHFYSIKKALSSIETLEKKPDAFLAKDLKSLSEILNNHKPGDVFFQIQNSTALALKCLMLEEEERNKRAAEPNSIYKTVTTFFRSYIQPDIKPTPFLISVYEKIIKLRNLAEMASLFDEIKNELIDHSQFIKEANSP